MAIIAKNLVLFNLNYPSLCFFFKKGGYSLVGKTAILHIVILGSIPNISIVILYVYFYSLFLIPPG